MEQPDNYERVRDAYEAYRDGFSKAGPPQWLELQSWMRDAMLMAYLQGKLDVQHRQVETNK